MFTPPPRQVHSWLQTVFSEGEVPPYEVNSGTLDTLYKMASQCQEREAQAQLLLTDLEQKTTEYQAESESMIKIAEINFIIRIKIC